LKRLSFRKLAVKYLLLPVMLVALLASPVAAITRPGSSAGSAENVYESYNYWIDGEMKGPSATYAKPLYVPAEAITADSLGLPLFDELTDICTDEKNRLFILDGGAGQIHILDEDYKLIKTLGALTYVGEDVIENDEVILRKGDSLEYKDAVGVFVKEDTLYVADTKSHRVLVSDMDGNVSFCLGKPKHALITEDFEYKPQKVAVDSKDYTYVSCDGSYYGALVYSPSMEFLGFYGANKVPATVLDVLSNLFDRLFSNDVKKSQEELSLPYQFVDMVVGPEDFIYTATGRIQEGAIQTGQISIMNPGGADISGKEGYNFADPERGSFKNTAVTQSIVGVAVDSDGFFYIIDNGYGRVYMYDEECNLISVFGGALGEHWQQGTNRYAVAIAVLGSDILVCDGHKRTVNVYKITAFGEKMRSAQLKTLADDFEHAIPEWEEIIGEDQNCQLAYAGLAKAYYTIGDNEKAAMYAELALDRETYSNAFVKLRQKFLEENFTLVFVGAVALIAGLLVLGILKKKKGWQFIKNEKLKVMLGCVAHPVESFRLVKEKQQGSLLLAFAILVIYYLLSFASATSTGFAYNHFDAGSFNSLYLLFGSVGLVLLFTIANWMVCVLLGGIGRLKEIFIVTCYCLIPQIFSSVISLVCTHVLVPDEFVFVELIATAFTLYTAFMMIIAIMRIHDFEFGRFLGTTALTVVAMLIIVFLIFLVFLLAQQVWNWVATVFVEIKYR